VTVSSNTAGQFARVAYSDAGRLARSARNLSNNPGPFDPGTPEVETSAFAGMFLNGDDSPGAH
jgi:hypothetical protein